MEGKKKEKRQRSNLDDEKMREVGLGRGVVTFFWLTCYRASNGSKRVLVATLKSATLRGPSGGSLANPGLYGKGKMANTYCIAWREHKYQGIEQRVVCTWPHQDGQSGEEIEAVPAPGPCPPKTELGVHVGHRRP
ncbi:hypothetical protein GE21DRAFT_1344283 [Neurospora crassa]|nr:hypothetical protein GE21DRAFT_1344283 [Neurospora crassa]